MVWQGVLDAIDAVESWIAGQSYWVQVVLLLAVFVPLCYLVAGLIDRLVEAVLARHSRRDQQPPQAAPGLAVANQAPSTAATEPSRAAGQ